MPLTMSLAERNDAGSSRIGGGVHQPVGGIADLATAATADDGGSGPAGLDPYDANLYVNDGVIRAFNSAEGATYLVRAVAVHGPGNWATFVNNGTIEAVSVHGEAFGIWGVGLYATVRNAGSLYVSGGGAQDPLGIVGIRAVQSQGINIENSGTIQVVSTDPAHSAVGISIFRDSSTIHAFGTVINSGTIIADTAIFGYAGYHTSLHVKNSGRIEGDLDFDLAQNVVYNLAAGVWIGRLKLGLDEDVVVNRGLIQGDVKLAEEDDLYDGRGGSLVGLLDGGPGQDLIFGGAGLDRLNGGAGNDWICGGGGRDILNGGDGADLFAYRAIGDSTAGDPDAIVGFESGLDRIDLSALAPSSVSVSAVEGGTVVTAQIPAGTLIVQVVGVVAESDLLVTPAGAVVAGSAGVDNLTAAVSGTQLLGRGGDDVLSGSAGNDRLNGEAGADLMRGGAGDDVYFVDNDGDRHIELAGGGTDEVRATVTYSLHPFAEKLTLLGTASIGGFGNQHDNIITGNSAANEIDGWDGADLLIGAGGADMMTGGRGADRFLYRAVGDSQGAAFDQLMAFETGIDKIDLSAFVISSITWVEFDNPWGAAYFNTATVETTAGAMTIRVHAKIALSDFIVKWKPIEGTERGETLEGTAMPNPIRGYGGNDILLGLAGNDELDGGTGADRLEGGPGDDIYTVDNAADRVVELAANGTDTVRSFISLTLGGHVENLVLLGGAMINAQGNELVNSLTGNRAANRLDGKAGADTMAGGLGHDAYVVDNVGDKVVENGSSGTDTIETSVDFTLPANVEKLVVTGTAGRSVRGNAGDNSITGNGGSNTINGGSGNDLIDAGAGNDLVYGQTGNDSLRGGAGLDRFLFNSTLGSANVDKILDFSVADDTISLARSVFTRAGANGTLSAAAFRKGTAAADASDRIIYDPGSGRIFYDADGNGAAPQVLFATVTAGTALTGADFVVYG